MARLAKLSIEEFLNETASARAVPGGGGVSALAGALGIALGDMVGELTVGKKKYAGVEAEIMECMAEARELMKELEDCMDKDAEAFEPLSKAYSMPKDTPGRDEVMEKCLKTAAESPMRILELSCRAMEVIKILGEKGSKLAISDAATGAALLKGAIYGARINVKVNTALMKDKETAGGFEKRADELSDYYGRMADEIYDSVMRRL